MTATLTQPATPPAARRRWWPVVRSAASATLAVAALGVFLAWMGGAFREKVRPGEAVAERPSSVGRTLVAVERVRTDDTAAAVGSVQPKKRTEVASQVLASVVDVGVRPGDRVEAGTPLVVLDDRELVAQQREATAALTAAEADLITRRADHERAKKARASGVIGEEEHVRLEGAFRVAEAQVTRAKEAIARLAVQLTHTKIAAAAAGLVADRFVDPGDLATPGKPLLVVYDPGDLELHANVPESLAPAVPVGTELAVRIDAVGVVARGTVREVVPQAQQASRSVLVKVSLPPTPSGKPLLPGMFGRVEIPVGAADRLLLPAAAVRRAGQLDLVEVANPDGTLSRRFVRIGSEVGGKVEILSGLAEGDRVALPAGGPSPR
ncbi:MAG: efflux RND transporter periplasmic adaptor subunit [Isosphaera sp.]|nr:efflux RND transporter periplasmic adaptor subunit [Isosphaera sp.]